MLKNSKTTPSRKSPSQPELPKINFAPLLSAPRELNNFDDLPLELRIIIWNLAVPECQALTISSNGYTQTQKISGVTHSEWRYRAKASYIIPSILHCCRESRNIGLKHYSRAFSEQLSRNPVYFNFEKDLLHFEDPRAMLHFYGGTVPGFSTECVRFKLNMDEVHEKVKQVSVGKVHNMYEVVGSCLNFFEALKMVVINTVAVEPKTGRAFHDSALVRCIQGSNTYFPAWSTAAIDRSKENGNLGDVQVINEADLEALINSLKGPRTVKRRQHRVYKHTPKPKLPNGKKDKGLKAEGKPEVIDLTGDY